LRLFCAVLFTTEHEILGLSRSVNKFCKTSYVYSKLKHVRDRQTDRQTDDLNSGTYYVTLAKYLLHSTFYHTSAVGIAQYFTIYLLTYLLACLLTYFMA